MEYRSKPHTIEAFHFDGTKDCLPEWFWEYKQRGIVWDTNIDTEHSHITVKRRGDYALARVGDYICRNEFGYVYILTEQEFEAAYEVDNG